MPNANKVKLTKASDVIKSRYTAYDGRYIVWKDGDTDWWYWEDLQNPDGEISKQHRTRVSCANELYIYHEYEIARESKEADLWVS